MSRIYVLPESLTHIIAAGEVIERPASVVKELVENAIDAGGHKIIVTVSQAGTEISVWDDGCGMSPEDAVVAFKRHATSKIAVAEDLERITTLGFRGEALPSIAAVSHICLTTRATDADYGTKITLAAGVLEKVEPVGAPCGSRFEIRDLFFNTPVRKKFLKSPYTEMGQISETILQAALAHPQLHFRLMREGKALIETPSVGSLKERALQLFNASLVEPCLSFEGQRDGFSLTALLHRPPLSGNHRRMQHLFLNGRPIKNLTLTHAVYHAYGNLLMKGEHPFFIVALQMDPASVDVNVHPTKREVRFQNADRVHHALVALLREALLGPSVAIVSLPALPAMPKEMRPSGLSFGNVQPAPRPSAWSSAQSSTQASTQASTWIGWPPNPREQILNTTNIPPKTLGVAEDRPTEIREVLSIRPLGQIYATFLLAEINGEMIMVDQHTAHERILYEQLIASHLPHRTQPLLIPVSVELSLRQAGVLNAHVALLGRLGWQIEPLGDRMFAIREMPAYLGHVAVEAFLNKVIDDLEEETPGTSTEDWERAWCASMACHSAIRSGRILTLDEIKALLTDYFERNTPPTCPHGRPVLIRVPLEEMERRFRRK